MMPQKKSNIRPQARLKRWLFDTQEHKNTGGNANPSKKKSVQLSRPRDTSDEAWSFLLNHQGRRPSTEKVAAAVELSVAVLSISKAARSSSKKPMSVKTIEELIHFVINGLNSAEIPHMIVGSFASTYHGLPRATQDLDLVCELDLVSLESLAKLFSSDDFYFNKAAAEEAIRREGMFNLVHAPSGWKIDLILRKNRRFSVAEFERRDLVEILGQPVHIATAEDTILSKLEWAKDSLSERQLRDVAEVLDIQGDRLDMEYLQDGIAHLGLEAVFQKARGPW